MYRLSGKVAKDAWRIGAADKNTYFSSQLVSKQVLVSGFPSQVLLSSFSDFDVQARTAWMKGLKNLSDWLAVNKLQFHPLKTKLMVVGSTYNLNTKSGDLSNVISIDNNLVSLVPSNKCLGVLLDEKLTFETHIECICKKAYMCWHRSFEKNFKSLLSPSAPS